MARRKMAEKYPVNTRNWYTAQEAAALLNMPTTTFHLHVKKGRIPSIPLPHSTSKVFLKSQIEELKEQESEFLRIVGDSACLAAHE